MRLNITSKINYNYLISIKAINATSNIILPILILKAR